MVHARTSLDLPTDKLRLYAEKPWAMVEELFAVKPDPAQRRALEAFPHTPRIAMQSCTGAGKSATLAWLGWNFLLTRPHAVVGAASVSKPTLKATLWPELSRWHAKSDILQSLFEVQEEQIIYKASPKTWHLKARSWAADANAEQIGNALRGFHADFVMWLLDESGGYPNAVLPVCEAIFSGHPKEAHIVQAGNPTHLSGPLYFAATRGRDHWLVIEITADPDDPERTPRVSVEHARQQIEAWGRDSPWVQVNIFGKFPPSSLNALIGPDEVEASMKRYWRDHDIGEAARIIGVDVARFGDDKSVLALRRGIQAFPFQVYRNLDSTQGAAQVQRAWIEFDADAVLVDDTGGFGAGWLDQLRVLGRSPIGVGFGQRAGREDRYANRRAEMYFLLAEWIKAGGALPECRELVSALTATTYTFQKDSSRLILAPKDEIKAKIGFSPDEADAIALTFAETVTPKDRRRSRIVERVEEEWSPYRETSTTDYRQF